jgi:hypothetical protein
MPVTFPTGVSARGNDSVIWVPTLADPSAPTVTELTSASAVNLSCALIGFSPSVEQATFTDTRLCSKQTFNRLGSATYSIDTLNYVYNPQAVGGASPDPDNVAYDALTAGQNGYFVHRRGLDAQSVDVAADQIVNVYPVELGAQSDVPLDPTAEGALIQCQQNVSVIGEVKRDVKVVAGA